MTESINLSLESHQIDDCLLDIEIEKKLLDTFFYRLENERTRIKLNNYDITSADYCRKLENKIKAKVLNESESTDDAESEDLQLAIKYILKKKEKYNVFFRSQEYESAIEGYILLNKEIDDILANSLVPYEKEKRKVYDDVRFENSKICSNVALCYEKRKNIDKAIEYCLKSKINYPFDKAYATLISCYLALPNKNVSAAEDIKFEMIKLFKEEELKKYQHIFNNLDEEIKKRDEVNFTFIF
jgi:hypothetical protein